MSQVTAIAEQVKAAFPEAVRGISEFRGEVTIEVSPAVLPDVLRYCKETSGLEFVYLSDCSGVDYPSEENRFHVNYLIRSLAHGYDLRVKVRVSEEGAIRSATSVFPGAAWPEREVYDMLGVAFTDHPDLRRLLMPHDWTGHPHRKDYPLGYEEVQFSFNYDRVQAKKPHPQE
jgi:NADH-quinone oxidoreductase subunit C